MVGFYIALLTREGHDIFINSPPRPHGMASQLFHIPIHIMSDICKIRWDEMIRPLRAGRPCWAERLSISAHLYPFTTIVGKLSCFLEGEAIPQKAIGMLSARANGKEAEYPPPRQHAPRPWSSSVKQTELLFCLGLCHRSSSSHSISPPTSSFSKGIANKCICTSAHIPQTCPSKDGGHLRAQSLTHWFSLAPRT